MEFSRKYKLYKDGLLLGEGTTKELCKKLDWTYKRVTYCIEKSREGQSIKGYTIEQVTLPADTPDSNLNTYEDIKKNLKIHNKELTRIKRDINMQKIQMSQLRLQLVRISQMIDELKGVSYETEQVKDERN